VRRLLASWFGSGLLLGRVRDDHAGSGTVGSLVALPIAVLVGRYLGPLTQGVMTVAIVILALWAVSGLVDSEGDAGWIVIDEAAGTFLALVGISAWPAIAVAFLVFRAADIFKHLFPGVAAAERLPGALGITADDLVAGVYGLVAGMITQALI
jgi:phosphatidylglycerophosphatase A